ncbi:Na+/H+ antiporter NhaA [Sphingomonas ginsenosidivorax]|uniref:Na(+)/H(+) antiporter NhaA n=1 Tax=Sphingomonas ginsenosidivorax TaxID=862135 RepID=A0A5C6UHV4_9SPHN|nr:Na+/H+ antiporter NhaA [Sphingomonas ginsenosidivorax]TXC72269.1 Na+/H+ antiporter NhaA [Sphingomonas ginsenosidivorax]
MAGTSRSSARAWLANPAAGGIVLIAAAACAIWVANSPLAPAYAALLHAPAGPLSVHAWIDDALMALFFLLVGLEIKYELVAGQLATAARRRLPFVAAAAGMAVPALVYLAIAGTGLSRGWAIPAATDIAFAIGVLALLGSRAPASLKVFLTAVAIADDMGAVAIIAVGYTEAIDLEALAAAAGVVAALVALDRHGERRVWPYLAGFALLWVLVLMSGVHATIAGVVAALTIPAAPARRIEHAVQPWVAFAILPLFAFANAGVALSGIGWATLADPLVLGVGAGLFVGKQAGILGAIWIADRTGFAPRPAGASWTQIWGVALLAGIGFTMSLFIGGLAFTGDPARLDAVKLGVLAGSVLAAVSGFAVLWWTGRRT